MTSIRQRVTDEEFEMPSLRLDGRVALVTGGSRGLGLGMALTLAQAGAAVALVARTEHQLEKAVAMVAARGGQALALPGDIGQSASIPGLIDRVVAHFGRLDILVNAAGINLRQPADTFTEADWDRLMAINLKGAFFTSQAAARVMRAQGGGRIINVGSITFEIAVPNITLYAISKGGLRQMTRALAAEWARDGINVNAVAPGRFWTEMTDPIFSNEELYESAVSVIPLGRPGRPADLAGVTLLLATEAGSYITGQTVVVDGGWLVNGGIKA